MPQIIRHYRPYTPPVEIETEPALITPQSCGSIGGKKTGRPNGILQPPPGVFNRLVKERISADPKLTHEAITGPLRLGYITKARRIIACELYRKHNWTGAQIARALERDASTVYTMIGTRRSSKHFGTLANQN